MEFALRVVRPWVRWAKERKLLYRMEETNTLSIQGLVGASDTHAAALFYVDYALTLIQAGVHGMNFHDSWCSAYSAIIFPSVRRGSKSQHTSNTANGIEFFKPVFSHLLSIHTLLL